MGASEEDGNRMVPSGFKSTRNEQPPEDGRMLCWVILIIFGVRNCFAVVPD